MTDNDLCARRRLCRLAVLFPDGGLIVHPEGDDVEVAYNDADDVEVGADEEPARVARVAIEILELLPSRPRTEPDTHAGQPDENAQDDALKRTLLPVLGTASIERLDRLAAGGLHGAGFGGVIETLLLAGIREAISNRYIAIEPPGRRR